MESTTSNSRGFTYEVRLCILCFLRGYTQNLRNFRLLHEVKIAGKFDDIIFDEGDETYTLIQLKHKDKEGKILSSNLFSEKYNTDYNLIKYVKALNETNSHENFANKIKRAYLFTNIPFGVNDENKLLVNNNSKTWFDEIKSIQLNEVELEPNHIIEYLEGVHETRRYFTFDDENIMKVLKTQSEDPKINVQFTDNELREALKLIVYAVGQPNVQELENIIKAEMRKSFHIEDVNTIYDKLERLMSEWFQSNNRFLQDDNSNENRKQKQFYLTYSDAETFFQSNVKIISFDVPSLINTFVGRVNELEEIRLMFNKTYEFVLSQKSQICKLAGIGKTELVKKFIKEYGERDFYGRVIWINAENDETVENSFRQLAECLKFSKIEHKQTKAIIDQIFLFFEGFNVLFVFDNYHKNKNENYVNYCLELVADSKTTIRPYFLFTTRDKKCLPEYLPSLDLDVLDHIDAEHLIKNGLKNLNYTQNDIEKLAKVLRYIPLELHKGIAYINTRNHNKSNEPYTIVDYLHDIEKKRLSLSNFLKTYDIDEISLVTWNITFGSIKNEIDGEKILNLLQILAYLNPHDINPNIFLKMFDNNFERVERALEMLQNYELVKITLNEHGIKIIQILRVVQEVLQLNFEHVEEDILEQAIAIINPQLVNEYLKSGKLFNKVEHNSSYYDVLENCTLNQALHIKNLRYYIKRKPKLERKYLKLCDDVWNKNFIKIILRDDVNQLALFEKSEDFWREFLQDNIEELFKNRCNKVIQYCMQIRVLMVDGVSSNVNESNLYLAAKYENLDLLKTIIQSGANTNRILEMEPVLNIFQRNFDIFLLLLPKIKFLDIIEVIDSKLIINLLTENFDTITSCHENLTMKSIDGLTLLHIMIFLACNFFVNILVKLYDNLNVADTDGNTPLHYAVQKSNFDIIELLVRNNADVNCPNNDGNTALHQAVRNKNFDVVKFLVANSANVNLQNNIGSTPLYEAVASKNFEVVRFLVEKSADVNLQNNEGSTPLYEAVASKNFEVVKYLVEKSADVNLQNNDGWTPLYEAVASKNFEVVKYLVENSADVNLQNNDGCTPLYEAVSGKNFEIVKYLVENSANVNISNRQGLTPLYEAVAGKNFEVVKFLVENFANVNHPNNDGETPLYEAVSGKNYEVVRYLVENKANLNFPKNNGWTPLYEAVAGKNFEVVRYLVEKLADVNLQNKRGCTPLFEAVTGKNLEVVKYLVQQGANINFQNKNGCTPLFEAVAGKNFEVVEYLVDNSANVNIKNNDGVTPLFEAVASKNFEIVEFLVNKGAKINVKNNNNETPLLEAITGNNFEIVEFLVKKGANITDWRPLFTAVTHSNFEIVEVLVNHGAQVKIQNNENKTLLSCANERNNFEIVEFLVRKKADLNFQYDDGSTPLLEAVLQKNFAIVEVLVKHGANVNHQNRDDWTPLLNAVAVNSFEIVEILVNHEANVNTQNNDGQTPLSIAIKNNNVEIIEFLRKHGAH